MTIGGIATGLAARGRRLPLARLTVPKRGRRRPGYGATVRAVKVEADDGVELYAEVQEAPGSPVTVIFCHGYLLNSTSWHVERATLAGRLRVVLWDLRGHGRSGWGSPPNATIDQVGRDLYAVLQATAPDGPVVLVGHSMGGMAILGLAEAHPELFGDRVVGVFLASTSAGDLSTVTVGLPARMAQVLHRVVPVTLSTLRHQARLIDAARRPLGGVSYLLTWPYLFGSRVPKQAARLTTDLMASVPIQVIADFYSELIAYDKRAALPVLGRVPVVVIVGEKDLLTPVAHAEALADAIPGAELSVVPGAGHLLVIERPIEVDQRLWALLERATGIEPATVPTAPDDAERPSRSRADDDRIATARRAAGRVTGPRRAGASGRATSATPDG